MNVENLSTKASHNSSCIVNVLIQAECAEDALTVKGECTHTQYSL